MLKHLMRIRFILLRQFNKRVLCVDFCVSKITYFGRFEPDGVLTINTDIDDDDYGEWWYFSCDEWQEFFKQETD